MNADITTYRRFWRTSSKAKINKLLVSAFEKKKKVLYLLALL